MDYNREYLFNVFQQLVFAEFNENISKIDILNADASERNIFRIITDSRSLIGIFNRHIEENKAFISFSESFRKAGLNVPVIYSVSDDSQIYLEEDLGNMTLHKYSQNASAEDNIVYFKKAIEDLFEFQTKGIKCIDFDHCYQTKEFSEEVIHKDFSNFEKYYLNIFRKGNTAGKYCDKVKEILTAVNSGTDGNYFLYRDFQTRNIMINENRLYYIDYQSGRRGPLHYDPASFLYSGSIYISESERQMLLNHYMDLAEMKLGINRKKFEREFYYFALMRLIQILGSYGITYEKKKSGKVLEKIPKALLNLNSLKARIEEKTVLKFIGSITE
ncbi:MAG: hypothetical protein JSS91_11610 [Bacteroidetes bacterium]|nr:hypothetical protein [Bacteroidota bacterium]